MTISISFSMIMPVCGFATPRRFGSLHWTRGDPLAHKLLRELGPEPLGDDFTGERLRLRAQGRKQAVKTFIMDSRIVVGVGNIYANEALFESGIHPKRRAGAVSLPRCQALVSSIKEVLGKALAQGGTTLRDFVGGDGAPGYFKHQLNVYDRAGLALPAVSDDHPADAPRPAFKLLLPPLSAVRRVGKRVGGGKPRNN